MSKEEAKALLDSLKGDERKMPITLKKAEKKGPDDKPGRDW
jgi:hypothetical protein